MTKQPMIAVMLDNIKDEQYYTVTGKNAFYKNSYIGTFELSVFDSGNVEAILKLHNKETIIHKWEKF